MAKYLVRNILDVSHLELLNPDGSTSPENIQGDLVGSLVSEDCRLSFYRLESPELADKIALAVASKGPRLDDIDYILVPEESIIAIGCEIDTGVKGQTGVLSIDELHVDICGLNLAKISSLANICVDFADAKRIPRDEAKKLFLDALKSNFLNVKSLRTGLKQDLGIKA